MAIRSRSIASGNREMTTEEFKRWLKRFDVDNDGRISRDELAEAVRYSGGWFARRKSKHAVRSADANGNGFIDSSEIGKLVDFARKHLGINIVDFY